VGWGLVAQMAHRITSQHRWAVTGTPIGASGLEDVLGLLGILHHRPFDDPHLFGCVIARPYMRGERGSGARLAALLKPVMWRSSKAFAARDHPLPGRTLALALLRFTPPEQAFYGQLLGKTREARDELQQRQAGGGAAGGAAGAALGGAAGAAEGRQGAEAGAAAEKQQQEGQPLEPSTAAAGRGAAAATAASSTRGRAAARRGEQQQAFKKAERLAEKAEKLAQNELLQLRLACIHPQLTQYWRELSSELQLDQGGALSMEEILKRMVEAAQLHLQNHERELCAGGASSWAGIGDGGNGGGGRGSLIRCCFGCACHMLSRQLRADGRSCCQTSPPALLRSAQRLGGQAAAAGRRAGGGPSAGGGRGGGAGRQQAPSQQARHRSSAQQASQGRRRP
jgi:hypothetical protein